MAGRNPDGSVRITKVPSITVPTGFKGIAVNYSGGNPGSAGIKVNNKPANTNYNSPSHGPTHLHGNWAPAPTPAPAPAPEPEPSNRDRDSYAHPMSAEFIQDTYDPLLGYENYNSPGDNPYVSNFTPKQFGYMNDLSTLSPDELDYREGNEKGLDDRIYTPENAGALLDNYIFNIKKELNKIPETKVGTITPQDTDLVRRDDELYGPYNQYNPERYY